jgi:16S rRNA (guanine966-N2)-methyltransferase
VRPTQAVVREAVFDLVGAAVRDAVVLDLFAGSGALGIEALSRGAAFATLVERQPRVVALIRRNLADLGLQDRARVVRAEVVRWLQAHPEAAAASLVLMDPPYGDPVLARTLALLDAHLRPGAVVVAEHARRQPLPDLVRLRLDRERRYGDTTLSVLTL